MINVVRTFSRNSTRMITTKIAASRSTATRLWTGELNEQSIAERRRFRTAPQATPLHLIQLPSIAG